MDALRIAATGMQAQQLNVDIIANNISNLNTTAFKRNRAAFSDLMYKIETAPGATTSDAGHMAPTGIQVGLGVNVGSVYKVYEQGIMKRTENVTDLGIQGRGFFKITLPSGNTAYTRDGSFQIDVNGDLVDSNGYQLDPNINIPVDAISLTISSSGQVSAMIDNVVTDLGSITLAMFVNDSGLLSIGDNLARETAASGSPTDVTPGEDGSGNFRQYHLESSNVDPIEEVTTLIAAQRAYELNSRVIKTADEMLSAVNQIR